MKYDEFSVESIASYAQLLENNCLKDAGVEYSVRGGKGKLGQLIEEAYFGYQINSRQEADFNKVNLELKVCPLRKIREKTHSDNIREQKGLSAKERIVITIINYESLVNEAWNQATVKNKLKLLLMLYIHEDGKKPEELIFELVDLWTPSKSDLLVIEKDWMLIKDKVIAGNAHLISEGDTMFLGACTKGVNANSLRVQPFSEQLAKQRAFSLKRSYVDMIIEELYQKRCFSNAERTGYEPWTKTNETFYDYLIRNLNYNIGKSISEIIKVHNIKRERKAKNYISLVVNDFVEMIIGHDTSKFVEFQKANIEMKTIVIGPDRRPKEHMSFEQINFMEIVSEEWETSTIREKFELKKQLWVVFQIDYKYEKQSDVPLEDIKFSLAFFWNMPINDLENDYFNVWKDTVDKIKMGNYNSFITAKQNRVGHVRPKGKDSNDLMITPQLTFEKKKCFWLNNTYIAEQIEKKKV